MRRLVAKLGFVHRTLWQRDQAYRWAVLLGPPPLFGCALALLAWAVVQQAGPHATVASGDIPWAHWTRATTQEGQPVTETLTGPLPPKDASGRFVGFQTGWVGLIQPMTVDATLETHISPSVAAHFTLEQPSIPLGRVLDAGPPTGLFVGTAKTFFAVPTAGLYAFSLRFARSSPQSADCLMWLETAKHRIVRTIEVNTNGQVVFNFPATEFQLQPGLLLLQVVGGCWRGDQMVGPGELTVMIRHPGESVLKPASADELIKPLLPAANGAGVAAAPPRH